MAERNEEKQREVRERMGLQHGGELSADGGLSKGAMEALMETAINSTVKKKRDRKNPSGRKRGGQPGNQNGAGQRSIYSRVDNFEARFKSYSKALGRVSAQEEVALARAMMLNLLEGKDPLGMDVIDDPEIQNAYARDLFMLTLKAKELYLKEENHRLAQEERKGNKGGVNIKFSAEAGSAMDGMVAAQEAAAAVNAADEAAAEGVVDDA